MVTEKKKQSKRAIAMREHSKQQTNSMCFTSKYRNKTAKECARNASVLFELGAGQLQPMRKIALALNCHSSCV